MVLRPWVGHPASEGGCLKVAALYERWLGRDPKAYLDRAIAAYGEALALNPNSFLTHQWLAEALLLRSEWVPAQRVQDLEAGGRHAEKALALNPKSREALHHRALFAILSGDWPAADRALAGEPTSEDALILRIRMALLRGRGLGNLVAPTRKARQTSPWNAELALWQGRLLEGLGQIQAAEASLAEARALNPNLVGESRRRR
jgi:tetratricopeptide (TPR) repeat protein